MVKIKIFTLLFSVITAYSMEPKKEGFYCPINYNNLDWRWDYDTTCENYYARYAPSEIIQDQRTVLKSSVTKFLNRLMEFKEKHQVHQPTKVALADADIQILKKFVEFDKSRLKIVTDGGTSFNYFWDHLPFDLMISHLKAHYAEYLTEKDIETVKIFEDLSSLEKSSVIQNLGFY